MTSWMHHQLTVLLSERREVQDSLDAVQSSPQGTLVNMLSAGGDSTIAVNGFHWLTETQVWPVT